MSNFSQVTGGNAPSKTGRNTIIAMTVLVAGFAGFYKSMHMRAESKVAHNQQPGHEYSITRTAEAGKDGMHITRTVQSETSRVFEPIVKERDAQHSTIRRPLGAAMTQPMPQRAKSDGSGLAYTKSPQFAHSYEKSVGGQGRKGVPAVETVEA